jgi:hypothetical protein
MGFVYDRLSPDAPMWLGAGLLALALLLLSNAKMPLVSAKHSS